METIPTGHAWRKYNHLSNTHRKPSSPIRKNREAFEPEILKNPLHSSEQKYRSMTKNPSPVRESNSDSKKCEERENEHIGESDDKDCTTNDERAFEGQQRSRSVSPARTQDQSIRSRFLNESQLRSNENKFFLFGLSHQSPPSTTNYTLTTDFLSNYQEQTSNSEPEPSDTKCPDVELNQLSLSHRKKLSHRADGVNEKALATSYSTYGEKDMTEDVVEGQMSMTNNRKSTENVDTSTALNITSESVGILKKKISDQDDPVSFNTNNDCENDDDSIDSNPGDNCVDWALESVVEHLSCAVNPQTENECDFSNLWDPSQGKREENANRLREGSFVTIGLLSKPSLCNESNTLSDPEETSKRSLCDGKVIQSSSPQSLEREEELKNSPGNDAQDKEKIVVFNEKVEIVHFKVDENEYVQYTFSDENDSLSCSISTASSISSDNTFEDDKTIAYCESEDVIIYDGTSIDLNIEENIFRISDTNYTTHGD